MHGKAESVIAHLLKLAILKSSTESNRARLLLGLSVTFAGLGFDQLEVYGLFMCFFSMLIVLLLTTGAMPSMFGFAVISVVNCVLFVPGLSLSIIFLIISSLEGSYAKASSSTTLRPKNSKGS